MTPAALSQRKRTSTTIKLLQSKGGSGCYPKLADNEPFPRNNIHEVRSPRLKARLGTLCSYSTGDKISKSLQEKVEKWNEKPWLACDQHLPLKTHCGCLALDRPQWREMTEQTDWQAKQALQVVLRLRRSKVLRSLRPICGHEAKDITLLKWLMPGGERHGKTKHSTIFLERMRKSHWPHYQSDEHWNCFKCKILGEISQTWAFLSTKVTIFNWTKLNQMLPSFLQTQAKPLISWPTMTLLSRPAMTQLIRNGWWRPCPACNTVTSSITKNPRP